MPPINLTARTDLVGRRYQQRYSHRRHADQENQPKNEATKIAATRSEATDERAVSHNVLGPYNGPLYAAKLKSQLLSLAPYASSPDDIPTQTTVTRVENRDPSRFQLAAPTQAPIRSLASEAHSQEDGRHDTDESLRATMRADEAYETLMTRTYQ